MKNDLIEIAYEIAKKKYKKGKFKYRDLLAEVIKSNSEYKNLGGDLYVEIISDIRFLSLGNDEWALQEYYKYDEFEKISSAMFGLDKELNEPELEDEEIVAEVVIKNEEDDSVELIEEGGSVDEALVNSKEEEEATLIKDEDFIDEIIEEEIEEIEIEELDKENE